jgi:glycosyltransferase involved in cell wall biosynthesis
MTNKKTAIMILTYNRKEYTQRTIENYERQLGNDMAFTFFVYENGSTDGTAEYFRNYKGKLNIDVTYGKENIGVEEGTKYLLKNKCFGGGFDFIIRADDDDLMPDGWDKILDYWGKIEKRDIAFAGIKRKNLEHYFEGYKWIATDPENMKMFRLGSFECYRAFISPGIQISTEKWWRAVIDDITHCGMLYGGWDLTLMYALKRLKKYFLIVYNYESDHIQKAEDYKALTKLKDEQVVEFEKRFETQESEALAKWSGMIKNLREQHRLDPKDPEILRALSRAYALKSNEKMSRFYREKLEAIEKKG